MHSILVVDDSKTFGSLMTRLVERETGCPSIWAKTYDDCRQALETAQRPFAAALLDLNLPDAPHGEVVDLALSYNVPSVVFTGDFSDELRATIWQKRIVDYVQKEGMHTLTYVGKLLKRLLRNKGFKTLVVDDSRTARSWTVSLLTAHGYEVYQASDGVEALAILEQHPDVRLMVTDYAMPRMDGVDLVKAVRTKAGMDHLAIIGVSAQGSGPTSVALLKSGANDFVTKPFSAEEFYCRVNQNVDMLNLLEDVTAMANIDFLTGLNNRKFLFDAGRKLFASQLRGDLKLTAAIMDIDFFKKVNDTYGHDGGDAVLKHFAMLLGRRFRGSDVVARFGGEEFCVLLVNMDVTKAADLLNAFREDVAATPAAHGTLQIPCTVSIGVNTGETATFEELLKGADERLYLAKQQGRNRVVTG